MRDYRGNARVIDGKIYTLGRGWRTKGAAMADAKKRRRQGYLVRVVHLAAGWYLYEYWGR